MRKNLFKISKVMIIVMLAFIIIDIIFTITSPLSNVKFFVPEARRGFITEIILYTMCFSLLTNAILNDKNKKYIVAKRIFCFVLSLIVCLVTITARFFAFERNYTNFYFESPNGEISIVVHEFEIAFGTGLDVYKKINSCVSLRLKPNLMADSNMKPFEEGIASLEWINENSFKIFYQHTKEGEIKEYIYNLE